MAPQALRGCGTPAAELSELAIARGRTIRQQQTALTAVVVAAIAATVEASVEDPAATETAPTVIAAPEQVWTDATTLPGDIGDLGDYTLAGEAFPGDEMTSTFEPIDYPADSCGSGSALRRAQRARIPLATCRSSRAKGASWCSGSTLEATAMTQEAVRAGSCTRWTASSN